MSSFDFSTAEIRKVKRVQFGILSPNEIRAMSVCEISSLQSFENGIPKECGIMDPRLGTVDRKYRCKTCSGTLDTCPGHFGHIELARPCYHPGYLSISMRILRCVCHYCSELLCDKTNVDFRKAVEIRQPRERLATILHLCEKRRCCGSVPSEDDADDEQKTDGMSMATGCGRDQPKYRKGKGVQILIEFTENKDQGEDKKQKLSAQRCLEIFSRISEVDGKILGFDGRFSKPEWMLIQVLPVSPPAVRPFVMMDGVRPSQDDLTYKLYDVVKTNNALKRQEARGVPEHVLEDLVTLLQFHVTTGIDNEVSGQPQSTQKSGKPIKSLRQRLVGKAGRVRGNLMGKRCDFSARTVIGGDPNLSIDEVGVPKSIAINLTYPEKVTKYNIHKMKALVENGPNTHPGAKTIIRTDGKQIDLRYVGRTADMNLEPGYIVERHIQNGDIVLFNRQPSLHKMSMMAHHVQILPYSTFRLNLSVTSPYNADFDGDEMNLHVPQSENARAELIQLCKVPTQIVSPQGNKPIMGIIQDTLLGTMKFTKRDAFFKRYEMFNMLMMFDDCSIWDGKIPPPAILKPEKLWTGKQIFSLIVPKVNVYRISNGHPDSEKNDLMSNTDTVVRIENGCLLSGIVDRRTVGTSAGSLIHVMFNERGPIPTMEFINALNKLIGEFLMIYSSSIGVGDTIASDSTLKLIEHEIASAKRDVARSIKKARNGGLQRQPGSTLTETFEAEVNNLLNKAMNQAGKSVQSSLHKLNNIKQMVDAGSKGNAINISQIIACVGQQNVMGKRIPYGFSNRTLPHFNKGDLGPESRGFVSNSYLQGLTPQEMYFHAMGGREGLVDTAVKTASTGYIQRRLIKAMEDVMVCYDRTVRNSLGHIIQFLYGEDGLDAVAIERQTMPHILLSEREFKNRYSYDLLNGRMNGDTFLDTEVREEIRIDHGKQIQLREEIQQLRKDREFFKNHVFPVLGYDVSLYLPVNIKRLIVNAQKEFDIHVNAEHTAVIHPVSVVEAVQKLCKLIVILPKVDMDSAADELRTEADMNATMLFKMLIRAYLASKRVCNEYRLTTDAFNFVIGEIKARFDAAIVNPGEVVGTIAAQSIGEPATQMTLNTFHFAGVSAKNVTLGVPRLAELINVAQNIKTPSLTIYLHEDYAMDQYATKEVLNKLEYCKLRDIVAKTQIYYDPSPKESVVEEDREFLDYFFDFPDADMADYLTQASPWMLRLVLDRNKKEDKNIKNSQVADKINAMWNGEIKCLFSNDNAEELVLQIRMMDGFLDDNGDSKMEYDDGDMQDAQDTFLRQLEGTLLDDVELRGIVGIEKVFMRQVNRGYWDDNHNWDKQKQKEWVLDTEGSALLDVMAVEEVDDTRTISNHIVHIFHILGIEAARQALLNEVRTVISFDGSYVNYRHLAILVDTMSYQGHLMSITRHGINRRDTGPIMRASFEETVEILLEASHFGLTDDLLGCSENILLGQLIPIGTGAFDLLLDDQMLEKYAEDENVNEYNTFATGDEFAALQEDQFLGTLSPSLVSPIYNKGWQSNAPMMQAFSPNMGTPAFSPMTGVGGSPMSMHSPSFSDRYDEISPNYSTSNYTSTSPVYGQITSPNYSPMSPGYSPTSPTYSPTSPTYSPTSPTYSPTSPTYSPTSPTYSPTSPTYSPTSPTYSPTSPTYSPTSPTYSPTSPTYSPTSPTYSPTSPTYSPTSPTYSPTSPTYSPTSPTYSPTSPTYSPTSPTYSPTSPTYSPTSPTYSPTSPTYSPTSPTYSPTSPTYSPSSPNCSPSSPMYSPHHSSPTSPTSPHTPNSPTSPTSPHTPHSPTSPISPTSPTSPTSPMSSPQTSPFTPSSPGSPQGMDVQYTPTWIQGSLMVESASSGPDYSSSGTSTTDNNARLMEVIVDYEENAPSSSDIGSSSTDSGDDSSVSQHDPFSQGVSTDGMGNYSPSGMGL